MNKKIIFFMPSMEGGGVEKNLVILINFLSNKYKNIKLISFDEFYKKKSVKKLFLKVSQKNQLKLINTLNISYVCFYF